MSTAPGPAVLRKVAWRLLPFLCLLYIFNIRNRSNISFRRETIEMDLGITPVDFDLAYGLFYFGYLLFQMPSNLMLRHIGARRALAAMMVTWGAISAATLAVTSLNGLSLMRILLGVAQAGFFPGVILYLTFWFPNRERARAIALFMVAISLSGVLGNPVAGAISHYLDGVGSWKGWQWILLLEGLPTMLLGLLVLLLLSDGPEHARWLSEPEREWLQARITEEQAQVQRKAGRLLDAGYDLRVWLLIAVYCTVAVGTNAAGAYLPKMIRKRFEGEDDLIVGLLLALPHLCAIVGMTILGAHSDRTGERRGHVALAAFVAAGGWLLALHPDSRLALVGFCLAQMGMMSMLPVFWAMPTAFLGGVAAAGGIALINSIANLGGLFGPTILGEATRLGREQLSLQDGGLIAMAIILFLGGVLVLFVRKE